MQKRAQIAHDNILEVYRFFDDYLGRVRRQAPNTLMIICSDHGFTPQSNFHFGMSFQNKMLDRLDITGALTENVDLPIPGMDASMRIERIEKWFELSGHISNFAYPEIIFSGPNANKAAKKYFKRLSKMEINGKHIFETFQKTRIRLHSFWLDHYILLPPFSSPFLRYIVFNGTHMEGVHGVVILNGPGVLTGNKITDASVFDIAPTLYAFLGIPPAKDLDGRVLEKAFSRKTLLGLKLSKVGTYGVAPGYMKGAKTINLSPDEINRLRSLGYLN